MKLFKRKPVYYFVNYMATISLGQTSYGSCFWRSDKLPTLRQIREQILEVNKDFKQVAVLNLTRLTEKEYKALSREV